MSQQQKVLVINNDDMSAAGILTLLRDRGYRYGCVGNKRSYELSICANEYIGAIMGDLRIPGSSMTTAEPWLDGLNILKDLRERGLPVLVLSAEHPDINRKANDLGARVMIKPTVPSESIMTEFDKTIAGYNPKVDEE